jgi:hypothetical protein
MLIINAIANLIIAVSVSAFISFVFGRMSLLDKVSKIESLIVKIALCLIASGSFFSFLTLSNPQETEVVLNVGLAFLFTWAALFHYKYFVKK